MFPIKFAEKLKKNINNLKEKKYVEIFTPRNDTNECFNHVWMDPYI